MTPKTSKPSTGPDPKLIRVSELGEFVRFESCERRFKLGYSKKKAARALPFFNRLMSPLDIVLQQAGKNAENEWQRQLKDQGFIELAPAILAPDEEEEGVTRIVRTPWSEFAAKLNTLTVGKNAYGREITVSGHIGDFDVEGSIDFFLVHWKDDKPTLKLIEGKHSRKDRTYHRIQVVTYWMLLMQHLDSEPLMIGGVPLDPRDVEIAVARIQEDTGDLDDLVKVIPLVNFDREMVDIRNLLKAKGRLDRILDTPIEKVDFKLCGMCDGCLFNINCLTESGRERRIELLGLEPTTSRTLRQHGVTDIDALASIDLEGTAAKALRTKPGFTESLSRLKARAKARKSTLLNEPGDPDFYPVVSLPGAGESQLPLHIIEGEPIIRIYLAVDYDYTENRVGALTAHVTRTGKGLHLKWIKGESEAQADGEDEEKEKSYPDPQLYERTRVEDRDPSGKFTGVHYEDESLLNSSVNQTVVAVQYSPWTGTSGVDTGAERTLLHRFFIELVEAIAKVANDVEASRLHFYLWNRNEMSHLIEACARADSKLLGHLRELLGSREGLEQLIFSCVGEEVERGYGLGWTGRGLVVATSLGWFGQRYHWTRKIEKDVVPLDRVFTQDIFDFKTTLGLDDAGQWVKERKDAPVIHKFEIRSRNFDSLPAPYWRAVWRTMPPLGPDVQPQVKNAVERYLRADRKLLLAYLEARVHALRWIEEQCNRKNRHLHKTPIRITDLPDFSLGIRDIGRASIDVLRLDGHVGANRWIAARMITVRERVANGITLPLKTVRILADNKTLTAEMDLDRFDIDLEVAQASWDIGMFVRMTIYNGDPDSSQSIKMMAEVGVTGTIEGIDWDTGQISIECIPNFTPSPYIFSTASPDWAAENMAFATLDESPSDFVSGRVEDRILLGRGSAAVRWFDPTNPRIPEAEELDPAVEATLRSTLSAMKDEGGYSPDPTQIDAVTAGLKTRVHLLQGPPGTGKTGTTALSIFCRIQVHRNVGDIVLVASNTHTAVNELVSRLVAARAEFEKQARLQGLSPVPFVIGRVKPNELGAAGADFQIIKDSASRVIQGYQRRNVVVLAGVTGGTLKLAKKLEKGKTEFVFNELIVDEASMMVFPHFLALSTLIDSNGMIMLAGDNRQLAPILAHEWDREDRPPIETYQPHISSYDAIASLCNNASLSRRSVDKSHLSLTFRLPPRVVKLIARVYEQDKITLEGVPRGVEHPASFGPDPWKGLWTGNVGLFLIVHDEHESRKVNQLEIDIVERIMDAAPTEEFEKTAVVTPHRAQKHMLTKRLRGKVGLVDTVERLQGGQRESIIVSGCASDPGVINSSAAFILDLKRSNVAFSRVQDRLMVVCSQSLLDAMPPDIEHYDSAMLWKALRSACRHLHAEEIINGHTVKIFGPISSLVESPLEGS